MIQRLKECQDQWYLNPFEDMDLDNQKTASEAIIEQQIQDQYEEYKQTKENQ